jgi:carboxymethylenebutenolidase
MRRSLGLALLFLVALSTVSKAGESQASFKSGADTVSAFLVTPEGKGPFPAVVVIHEWWGLNGWTKDQARALAKEGYVALGADLYRGKSTDSQDEAHQLMNGLSPDQGVRDLKAAFSYLASRPDVKKDKIGVIGWCMGGRYSFALAVAEPALAAAVVYYGAPPTDPADIQKIKAPILGNFGGDDKGPSPDDVKKFDEAARAAGKSFDHKIYPGAGHAFANVNNPWHGYREEAAKDAWNRTVAFFAAHLKK